MSANNIQTKTGEHLQMMPREILKDFYPLLKVQSSTKNEHAMVGYIVKRLLLMKLNYSFDAAGNILVIKGESKCYPCIVAHMDTVHEILDDFKVKIKLSGDRERAIAHSGNKQVGVGGDDKCGLYAVFYMLERVHNIKAVFFTQEEGGMIGSNNISHDFFNDVGYIIQLDRWGRGDFIDVYCGESTVSPAYKKKAAPIMERHGYNSVEGLITDSISLWDSEIGISCVNVSCGYYQHHSASESIDLNEMYNSLLFTFDLIIALGEERYESVPDINSRYKKYYRYGEHTSYDEWFDEGDLCGKTLVNDDILFDAVDFLGIDIFEDDLGYTEYASIYDEYMTRNHMDTHVSYLELTDRIDRLREEYNKQDPDYNYSYNNRLMY